MTTDRPRLFVELCCGSAAVTLKLLGGRHATPPISYMGSKRGLAVTILGAMGLRSGIGADAVLLCDAGPWAHVWSVLADPARCAEVAATLRGWADEEPRELWERLREEHRGEWDGWTAERAAGWLQVGAMSARAWGEHHARLHTCPHPTEPWRTCEPQGKPLNLAHRLDSVAAWLQVGAWSGGGKGQESGYYAGPFAHHHAGNPNSCGTLTTDGLAARLDVPTAPLAVYAGPAEDIEPPPDCSGVYVYLDPPYKGTTGYAASMPREVVLDVAQRWSDAGAVVCVSEAEPLELDGWHHLDIASARQGQKRTFSKQQREVLTLNREPAHRPAEQVSLF